MAGPDDVLAIYQAFASGKTLKEAGIPDIPENQAYWNHLEQETAKLPPGTTLDIPFEFPEEDAPLGYSDEQISRMSAAFLEHMRRVDAGEPEDDDWLFNAAMGK